MDRSKYAEDIYTELSDAYIECGNENSAPRHEAMMKLSESMKGMLKECLAQPWAKTLAAKNSGSGFTMSQFKPALDTSEAGSMTCPRFTSINGGRGTISRCSVKNISKTSAELKGGIDGAYRSMQKWSKSLRQKLISMVSVSSEYCRRVYIGSQHENTASSESGRDNSEEYESSSRSMTCSTMDNNVVPTAIHSAVNLHGQRKVSSAPPPLSRRFKHSTPLLNADRVLESDEKESISYHTKKLAQILKRQQNERRRRSTIGASKAVDLALTSVPSGRKGCSIHKSYIHSFGDIFFAKELIGLFTAANCEDKECSSDAASNQRHGEDRYHIFGS